MSVKFDPIYAGYSSAVNKSGEAKAVTTTKTTSPLQDKTSDIDKAMSVQGLANKPIVITSDEVTFNDNGIISAQRLISTYQGGKLTSKITPAIPLPIPNELSLSEQKAFYVDKSLENSTNIKNCVFLMKNTDGSITQYSMAPDKNMPNRIIVSSKNSGEKDFKPIDDFRFDASSKDTDRLMQVAVHTYIDMNGFENLCQFAVAKTS